MTYNTTDWPALPPMSALVNQVHCMDALDLLRLLPDASVDCVVTSPPYNLKNSTGGGMNTSVKGLWTNRTGKDGWYDTHDDNMPHDEYVAWQRSILVECMRVIKPAGAIFYNHKWRVQAGLLQDRADIVSGFPVRQIIIWDRGIGFNFNNSYLLPMYEVIYMIAKPDYKLIRGANVYSDVWHIKPEEGKEHPNAFPVEIPRRCIEISGAKLVVDPFGGRGTTARAAVIEGADYITGDISTRCCEMARKYINQRYTPSLMDLLPVEALSS